MPQEIKVSDRIQNLVFHKFIGAAQTVFVQNTIIIHHDSVVHAASQGQSAFAQGFDIAHETEGSRPAHFLHEGRRGKVDAGRLHVLAKRRVFEINGKRDFETFVRFETGPFVAVFDLEFAFILMKRFGAFVPGRRPIE